jgi:hypothetical protein
MHLIDVIAITTQYNFAVSNGWGMNQFKRTFDTGSLAQWADGPDNLVSALFRRWALPGRPSSPSQPLRLGIRDGYANFYVKGQSVAKVTPGRAGTKVSIHRKYVNGERRAPGVRGNGSGETRYAHFLIGESNRSAYVDALPRWISTAESYASAEKRFVDHVISENEGVIDLEMGLPADQAASGSEKSAPRMDLVVAQTNLSLISIAFWEAKCSTNPELRAGTNYDEHTRIGGPSVINQLRRYERWMSLGHRVAEVQDAYRASATILLECYRLFAREREPDPDCVGIWRALERSETPHLVLPPAIVIGNYCPTGLETMKIDASAFKRSAKSFSEHRGKLRDFKIKEIESDHDSHALPLLIGEAS